MIKYPSKIALLVASALILTHCPTVPIQSESGRWAVRELAPIAPPELMGATYLISDIKMPGEYMKVFNIAYGAFLIDKDIPANKRSVENYRVELRQDSNNYEVNFIAKRNPAEIQRKDGGSGKLGRDITYIVNKKTYEVIYGNGNVYK